MDTIERNLPKDFPPRFTWKKQMEGLQTEIKKEAGVAAACGSEVMASDSAEHCQAASNLDSQDAGISAQVSSGEQFKEASADQTSQADQDIQFTEVVESEDEGIENPFGPGLGFRGVKKYTRVQRKLVLDLAVPLTLDGKGISQVHREIQGKPGVPPGISKVTIQKWLDDFFLRELGDVKVLICRERARQIEHLYKLYKQCLEQYHESAKPKKKVVRTSRSNSQNGKNGPQGGTKVFRDVVTVEENNVGDPRFLAEARAALRDIRILCGMESRDVNMIFQQTVNQDNSVGKTVQSAIVQVTPSAILAPLMKSATDDELRLMRSMIERAGVEEGKGGAGVPVKVVNEIVPPVGRSFGSYPNPSPSVQPIQIPV